MSFLVILNDTTINVTTRVLNTTQIQNEAPKFNDTTLNDTTDA